MYVLTSVPPANGKVVDVHRTMFLVRFMSEVVPVIAETKELTAQCLRIVLPFPNILQCDRFRR
jgi:hypothetical protein